MTHLGTVKEKSSRTLKCRLVDGDGVPVNAGSVSSITLWLRDLRSATLIVTNLTVFPTGGGAIDGSGYFTFPLTATHTSAVGTDRIQRRVVTLDITFTTGRLTHELSFDVENLVDIT